MCKIIAIPDCFTHNFYPPDLLNFLCCSFYLCIHSVISVCSFIGVRLGDLQDINFLISFENPAEPLNIVLSSH